MSRPKPIRILWAIAALVVLSLVAGMVLHKPYQPKIIGKLSQDDISQLSRLFLNSERQAFKSEMKEDLRQGHFRMLIQTFRQYVSIKVSSLRVLQNGEVQVHFQIGTNESRSIYQASRADGVWKIVEVDIF